MNCTKVSVVIPFFNSNAFINETLSSVLCQDFLGEVIIVVDMGSEIPSLEPFSGNSCIKVVFNRFPFRGSGVCRSLGFNAASFRYVAFIDADDIWYDYRLREHISYVSRHDLAFSFAPYRHFDASGNREVLALPPPYSFENFLRKRFTIGCLTVIIDKLQINSLPPICIKRRNDYLMWHFVLSQCEQRTLRWSGFRSDLALARHRLHDKSLTQSRFKSACAYFLYLHASGHSFLNKFVLFFFYFYYTFGTR